ncbi:MAG: sigma-70 family RNA polymerase sigma factor [Planctomycetota bacterium]
MIDSPNTRESLILRLPSARDAAAWQEFAAIYEPLVYRFARRQGLQDADAHELVQNVFLSVAKAVGGFQPDPERGKFRTWLFCIARNHLINLLRKRRPDEASGRSDEMRNLQQLADSDFQGKQLQAEYRQELFRSAAVLVKEEVRPATWEAFWKTAVEGRSVEATAQQLDISVGAVYIARSRILQRLRDRIQSWETSDE